MGGHAGSFTARRILDWPVFEPAWSLALFGRVSVEQPYKGASHADNKKLL